MEANRKHNNPPVLLELDPELADFILENCDANISLGMGLLQSFAGPVRPGAAGAKDRLAAEKLVANIEKSKKLQRMVLEAVRTRGK